MTEKEIATAREAMETYVNFVTALPEGERRQFYIGAASAINDLMCRVGHGDAVESLTERLNKVTSK